MPTYEIELSDGRVFEVESDAPPSEADVMAALPTLGSQQPTSGMGRDPEPQGSGGATAAVMGARGVPAAIRTAGRFAANHPSGVQKTIGAGTTAAASLIGGAIGSGAGPTGAIAGALGGGMVRGLTPTQAGIRETAGRMAGEAPDVARTAGRAVGVANYGNEMGLKVKPTGLISTGEASRAFDNYADANGLKAPRILEPTSSSDPRAGRVIYGPEAPPKPTAPSRTGRIVTSGARGIGKALSAVSGPIGMTDFAQTVEPDRRDIGVMGIGASQPDPSGDELSQINQRNVSAMEARQAEQAARREQMRQRIFAMFGIQ